MRIWISSFLVLFAIAELYQWFKHLTLPLPIYILGGAFLAIASNYNKRASWPWREPATDSGLVMDSANSPSYSNPASQQPPKSISFTIPRSSGPKE